MIKYLKLINGDELVAKVEDHDSHYLVIWPARIYMDRTEEQPRTRVEPYCPHVLGHTFKINKTRLLFVADPVPTLEEYYSKTNASMLPQGVNKDNELPGLEAANEG